MFLHPAKEARVLSDAGFHIDSSSDQLRILLVSPTTVFTVSSVSFPFAKA